MQALGRKSYSQGEFATAFGSFALRNELPDSNNVTYKIQLPRANGTTTISVPFFALNPAGKISGSTEYYKSFCEVQNQTFNGGHNIALVNETAPVITTFPPSYPFSLSQPLQSFGDIEAFFDMDGVGVMVLSSFEPIGSFKNTANRWISGLTEMKRRGIQNLVLDLSNNGFLPLISRRRENLPGIFSSA